MPGGIPSPTEPVAIDPEFASKMQVQSYEPKPRIDGVQFVDLKRFVDDGGSFLEIARLMDGALKDGPEIDIRQINYAVVEPRTIKAFHLHLRQSELWFVPPESRLLMGLLDVRQGSPTHRLAMRFVLGGGQTRLVTIPAGVAHGVSNLSDSPASIIYLTNQEFNPHPERCDEKRLPWDLLGEAFWEPERG